ncbi:unnamed protein product [Arctogadus glacialis]
MTTGRPSRVIRPPLRFTDGFEEEETSCEESVVEEESPSVTQGRSGRSNGAGVWETHHQVKLTNSFIIHKACASLQQVRPMTRQQFQELAAHLLGVDHRNGLQKTSYHHLPVPTSDEQTKSKRATGGRRRCKLCQRSTAWQCEDCAVGLCLQPDRNCFRQYHQGLLL